MWKTCENKWCGSKYEQAYKDGYNQGFSDAERINKSEAFVDSKRIKELEDTLRTVSNYAGLPSAYYSVVEELLGKKGEESGT